MRKKKIDNQVFKTFKAPDWIDIIENEKVWGLIDCSESVNCIEALFYMIAILTFFVVVFKDLRL